ncbi:unnamed protein product, partial [Musa textilis]
VISSTRSEHVADISPSDGHALGPKRPKSSEYSRPFSIHPSIHRRPSPLLFCGALASTREEPQQTLSLSSQTRSVFLVV